MGFLLETSGGRSIYVFDSKSETDNGLKGIVEHTRVEKIHQSQVICCSRKNGYGSLFCVNFGCHNVWVEGFDAASAIVTALRVSSLCQIKEVSEYYTVKEDGLYKAILEEKHYVPEFVYPLFECLDENNIDLVSLALSYAIAAADEEKMKKWEILGIGEENYRCPLSLSTAELYRRVKVWHFPTFVEETEPSQEVFSLYRGCEDVNGIEELLCLSYLFERWADVDSVYPYSLFRFLLDGRLKSTIEKLAPVRRILFG